MRLDIAMHHAAFVSVLQSDRRLLDVVACFSDWQCASVFDCLRQVNAVDVLHHHEVEVIGLVGVVRGHNVWMRQLRGGLHFTVKSIHRFGFLKQCSVDDLQRRQDHGYTN